MGSATPNRAAPGGTPRLMVITDSSALPIAAMLERIEWIVHAAETGSVVIQLRDKHRSSRERLDWGRRLRAACAAGGQRFVVNDRCDLARVLEADGVHLPEAGLCVSDARRLLGESAWISRAAHSLEALQPLDAGIDAWVLSPILQPRKGREPLGTPSLTRARERLASYADPPLLVALGGVDARRAGDCLRAGADAVAVMGAAYAPRRPQALLERLGILRAGVR